MQLGLGCLEGIYEIGGSVDFLMTLPDEIALDKSGRALLNDFATVHGVALHKIRNINDPDAVELVRDAELDWLFIIGWSQIARKDLLDTPRCGCLGMHPTLLPRGRGRASIPWAIIKGLDETGVTMFKLDEGVDTGPIIGQVSIPIEGNETATTLYAKVTAAHRALMRDQFPRLQAGGLQSIPQDESQATTWPGRTPADGRLAANMSVEEMDRLVRATTHPYPGAFTESPDGTVTTIWSGSRNRSATATPIRASDGTYWATDMSSR